METGKPEYIYRLREVHSLPVLDGNQIAWRPDMEVVRDGTKEIRLIGIKGKVGYYACYREIYSKEAEILVTRLVRDLMPSDTVYSSLFARDRRMIEYGGLILHCAYINHRGKGILFSAPSGVGKSTQAALWEKYRGSEIVNGDRTLLRKKEGKWLACAWPVCGSSNICKRMDISVYAIVMLRQGKENSVVRLSPAKAFRQLYPQMTINQWNPEFIQAAINGIENLILQVPVWQLTCDMTEDAVKCLEAAIFPDTTIKMR